VTDPGREVFLSYASQDAEAAQKICEALRAGGVEVFLDQSELRGGDAWDQSIRKHIKTCALFIPIISQNTHARAEGYFRLEWKLAVDRSHLISADQAFLLPVVIDETPDDDERVPERFREVQWTRLPGGATSAEFVARVLRLLTPESKPAPAVPRRPAAPASVFPPASPATPAVLRRPTAALLAILAGVVALALSYFIIDKFWISKRVPVSAAHGSPAPAAPSGPAPAAFAPPPHSIAVLPFLNMSGDKDQEYFSDGLTEELLNSLARINELQVAARTSAFMFKGKDTDIGTIARKLNVAAVLEGSVRRSGHTVRITAQLINAVTGFHLWSDTYDRDLGDVLKLQTEIATEVASTLKVTLLGDVVARIELGGTHNPAALDAYLRGRKAVTVAHTASAMEAAIAAYTEAIRFDPHYALALANRSIRFNSYASEFANGAAIREYYEKAQADARRAIELAPDLAEGHLAFAGFLMSGALDFTRAGQEAERALALAPGNAQVQGGYAEYGYRVGRFDAAITAARRAVVLDPLNPGTHSGLAAALLYARHFDQAVAAYTETLSLSQDRLEAYADRGLAYYALGDFQNARSSCELKPDYWQSQLCLAITYDKLGRHADAEGVLAKLRASQGDDVAYQYAEIYAQWGETAKALQWLDTTVRLRDPGLSSMKVDPLMDPLRKEPRFQAIERELKFPT
jgi:TolB-like protein/tetratricopeptide (TPR) repeat protein